MSADDIYLKPEGHLRVLAIDPSTTNMGVTVLDVNLAKPEPFKLRYVNTIFGEKVCYGIPEQFDDLAATGVLARSWALARAYRQVIELFEPDTGIVEDNFLGASPGTFKQLIQAVALLREAANTATPPIHVSYVLPRLAKEIVGANFRGTTKDDVIRGVLNYSWLDRGGIDLSVMDDHSADSLAIGLYRCEQIAKDYGVYHDPRAERVT